MIDLRCSVIIPAYRAATTIQRAIDSVLAQTSAAHEILVIDDGSPDDLKALLQSYGNKVRLICQENMGAATARNVGIELATGGLLAFLDADDYWEPEKLQCHQELHQQFPQLGLSHSRYFEQLPGTERHIVETVFPVQPASLVALSGARSFSWATAIWTGTVVVPREILGASRFVSGLEPAEDRDLWVRLLVKAPVYCIPIPLATAVLEPGSLSRANVARDCTNMLKVVARHQQLIGMMATRKWQSHTYYRWSACTENATEGLRHYIHSALLWPLPLGRGMMRFPLARLRLLARLLQRIVVAALTIRFGKSPALESPALGSPALESPALESPALESDALGSDSFP